jgi:hypothetical protein
MTTLSDMTADKQFQPSAEELTDRELGRLRMSRRLSLTGPDELLKQFTKNTLETALKRRDDRARRVSAWGSGSGRRRP